MPEELNTSAAFKRWTDSRAHSPERIRGACLTQPLPITTIHHSARKSARAGPALVSIEPPPIFTFAAPVRDSTAPTVPRFRRYFHCSACTPCAFISEQSRTDEGAHDARPIHPAADRTQQQSARRAQIPAEHARARFTEKPGFTGPVKPADRVKRASHGDKKRADQLPDPPRRNESISARD